MVVADRISESVEESLGRVRRDGWCVVEGVIPAGEVSRIRQSVEDTVLRHGTKELVDGVGTRKGLIAFDQSYAPYLADRRVLGVAEAMFGHHVRISFTTAHINYPGNDRGGWHSDWPFNQNNAGHVAMPYPDAALHLTTLWMLSSFSQETGGTLVVPGSHRSPDNPTGDNGVDPMAPYPTEMQATGDAGSVLMFDSRLWHATATNRSDKPRIGMPVRYAPWWLNLDVLRPGSDERSRMVDEVGARESEVTLLPKDVFEGLPEDVKPLYRHWLED